MNKTNVLFALIATVGLTPSVMAASLSDRLSGLDATPLANEEMGEVHARYMTEVWEFLTFSLPQSDPDIAMTAWMAAYYNSELYGLSIHWEVEMGQTVSDALTATPPLPQPPIPNLPSVYTP